MRKLFSLKFILPVICLMFIASSVMSQDDLGKPAPVDNAAMKMLVGTWKSDPYEMMGMKWNETAVHSMKLNGQYMFIDITATNDKGVAYNATVIMQADKNGNLTGWSFDDWGMSFTYTGKSDGGHVKVTGTGAMGSEVREIDIKGDSMTHNVTETMKGKDGKDMTSKLTVTYHKQ